MDLLEEDCESIIVTMNLRDPALTEPYRLRPDTCAAKHLAINPGGVRRWIVGPGGQVRMAIGRSVLYRDAESGSEFREIVTLGPDETFSPKAFAPDGRTFYAYSSLSRDKIAIVEIDPAAGHEVRTLNPGMS